MLTAPEADPDDPVDLDGRVLRRASDVDRARRRRIANVELPGDYACFSDELLRQGVPLRLVAVERLFGGERLVFYVEPGAPGPVADVAWSGLVEAVKASYPGTRVEIREVGESVRPLEVGCGSGGGCSKDGCASKSADADGGVAGGPSLPPMLELAGRVPKPLPMAG